MSTSYPPEQERARRFHRHVLADVDYLKSIGYNPTRFLVMIGQDGSAATVAKKLFLGPRHTSYGFERLWEVGELGRTVEFVANLPWFRDLFTESELDKASPGSLRMSFPLRSGWRPPRRIRRIGQPSYSRYARLTSTSWSGERAVDALAGKPLLIQRPRQPVVDVIYISWHHRQVFKRHRAEATQDCE